MSPGLIVASFWLMVAAACLFFYPEGALTAVVISNIWLAVNEVQK
jgi:hypothetical protein